MALDLEPVAVRRDDTGPNDTDGRHRRRLRNRDAVVDALLALYREGNLRPSTDEIAERAGISPRSLFRYFSDVDDLSRAAIARQHELVDSAAELDLDRSLPLHDRAEQFAAHRIRLHEAVGLVAVVTRLRAPFQPVVAAELDRLRRFLAAQLRDVFEPELARLAPTERTSVLVAADAVCSYESYRLLRDHHRLSARQATAALRTALLRLLEERTSS